MTEQVVDLAVCSACEFEFERGQKICSRCAYVFASNLEGDPDRACRHGMEWRAEQHKKEKIADDAAMKAPPLPINKVETHPLALLSILPVVAGLFALSRALQMDVSISMAPVRGAYDLGIQLPREIVNIDLVAQREMLFNSGVALLLLGIILCAVGYVLTAIAKLRAEVAALRPPDLA